MTTPLALTICAVKSTPIGEVWLAFSPIGLYDVSIGANQTFFTDILKRRNPNATITVEDNPYAEQVNQYFAGERLEFDMPIDWAEMPSFNKKVLQRVMKIPAGETMTYGRIAAELDNPNGARAVGGANAGNPMPLIVPCHRVIGANGKLHGYSGGNGITTKAWLLEHEGVSIAFQPNLF